MRCWAAPAARCPVRCSVGMIGTSTLAAAFAAYAGFLHTLLIVCIALLLCVPLMLAGTQPEQLTAVEGRVAD